LNSKANHVEFVVHEVTVGEIYFQETYFGFPAIYHYINAPNASTIIIGEWYCLRHASWRLKEGGGRGGEISVTCSVLPSKTTFLRCMRSMSSIHV
jgi:hypothetical protein